jgi:hypothetical protein
MHFNLYPTLTSIDLLPIKENRVRNSVRFFSLLTLAVVTGAFVITATRPKVLADTSEPAPILLPKGYDTLAGILALEIKTSPKLFRSAAQYDAVKVDADLHGAIMTMRDIHSDNDDVNYVASLASQTFDDTSHTLEGIDAAPVNLNAQDSFPWNSIFLFAEHHYLRALAELDENDGKNAAKTRQRAQAQVSVNQLASDMDKIQTAMLLLPKIAAKYSAPISPNDDHLKSIFVGAWGPVGPNDLLALENNGPELKNCTIVVDIQGTNGETHQNVHFVPNWPTHSPLFATYAHGQKIFGRMIGQLTFNQVTAITVTLLSPEFSTQIHSAYDEATRDKQIADICKNLKITYHYTVHHALLSTTRDGDLTMDGVASLPASTLDLTMHKGDKLRTYRLALSPWKQSERKTFPALTLPADTIDVVLSFPNTTYRYQTTLQPQG